MDNDNIPMVDENFATSNLLYNVQIFGLKDSNEADKEFDIDTWVYEYEKSHQNTPIGYYKNN